MCFTFQSNICFTLLNKEEYISSCRPSYSSISCSVNSFSFHDPASYFSPTSLIFLMQMNFLEKKKIDCFRKCGTEALYYKHFSSLMNLCDCSCSWICSQVSVSNQFFTRERDCLIKSAEFPASDHAQRITLTNACCREM